jgi:hypothetical protein
LFEASETNNFGQYNLGAPPSVTWTRGHDLLFEASEDNRFRDFDLETEGGHFNSKHHQKRSGGGGSSGGGGAGRILEPWRRTQFEGGPTIVNIDLSGLQFQMVMSPGSGYNEVAEAVSQKIAQELKLCLANLPV